MTSLSFAQGAGFGAALSAVAGAAAGVDGAFSETDCFREATGFEGSDADAGAGVSLEGVCSSVVSVETGAGRGSAAMDDLRETAGTGAQAEGGGPVGAFSTGALSSSTWVEGSVC